jgi:antitoxin CptB
LAKYVVTAAMIGAANTLVSFYNRHMKNDPKYNRLCWHSRRGMLELDLVLGPFVKECYPHLSTEDQTRYEQLLTCEDQDLFSWFIGRVTPQDEDHAQIVDKILEFARRPV